MRIGLYGGTFDPIHAGHIEPVLAAKRRQSLDRVVYLPTARPPHKQGRVTTPAHRRFVMVELALLEHRDLVVSDLELTPEHSSFTIDSVEHFARTWPEVELFLIIGGDSFVELPTWHRWRELVSMCGLAVLNRPGWDAPGVSRELDEELAGLVEAGTAVFVDNPAVDVSSTDLRRRLAADEAVGAEMMPPLVVEYVRKYSLYS